MLAGKKILMINNVAVLEPQQFFRECLRRLAGQLAIQPLQQDLSLSVIRLPGFLGRHLGQLEDLLRFTE